MAASTYDFNDCDKWSSEHTYLVVSHQRPKLSTSAHHTQESEGPLRMCIWMCVWVCAWVTFKALMANFHCGHLVSSDNVTVVSSVFQLCLQTHVSHKHVDKDTRHAKERLTDSDGHFSSVHCVPSHALHLCGQRLCHIWSYNCNNSKEVN